jgi:hypothetical protein
VSRVAEYCPPKGPAPAQMVRGSLLFAFQTRRTVYCVPASSHRTVSTEAALGENVPAKPPDSFHATTVPVPKAPPLTQMPMSWL